MEKKDENEKNKIVKKLEALLNKKLEIVLNSGNSGNVDIADIDINGLQSNLEKDGDDYKINYRMTEGFLKALGILKKIINEKNFDKLLKGIAIHEKLENLYKIVFEEYYKEIYKEETIEVDGKIWLKWEYYLSRDAHEFAMEFAGNEQRIVSENFKNLEKLMKLEEKINEEDAKNLKEDEIEEAINNIAKLKRELKEVGVKVDLKEVYKTFSNLKKEINNYVEENALFSRKEIVININGKDFKSVSSKLIKLKLQNNYGLKVILVGELGNLKDNNELKDYLSKNYKTSLCDLTWVLGKTLIKDKKFKRDEKIHRVVEVLGNGYLLSASGVITNKVYNEISKALEKQFEEKGKIFNKETNIPNRVIASILNLGFFDDAEYKEVYENFINSKAEDIKENINQIILGAEVKLDEKLINKVSDKEIKVIERQDNGLVLVKNISEKKIGEISLADDNNISVEALESLEVVKEEKIELEGLDKKALRLETIGYIAKRAISKVLKRIGLKNDRLRVNMNENIKAFASAA